MKLLILLLLLGVALSQGWLLAQYIRLCMMLQLFQTRVKRVNLEHLDYPEQLESAVAVM